MNWAALGLSGIRRVLVRVIDLAEAGCSAPVRVLRSVPSEEEPVLSTPDSPITIRWRGQLTARLEWYEKAKIVLAAWSGSQCGLSSAAGDLKGGAGDRAMYSDWSDPQDRSGVHGGGSRPRSGA